MSQQTMAAPFGIRSRLSSMPRPALLRLALGVDAAVTGANGAAYLALAGALEGPLGIEAQMMRAVGAFLLLFAAGVWLLSRRSEPGPRAVAAVIDANAAWALASIVVLAAGWLGPTTLGAIWIALQALVVAGFAVLQLAALRRPADPA